jgi:hypothetical protein
MTDNDIHNRNPPTSSWYHEAGHAVAAVLCRGHVNYIELGDEPITDAPVEGPTEQAFKVWAGPWAQVYQEDNGHCSIERIAGLFHSQSLWDWPLYEEAMDPVRAAELDIAGLARDAEFAALVPDHPTTKKPEQLPPVTAPDPSWHDKLSAAWTEIAGLAESLLNGETPITLSNGQELVRFDGFDYWYDPDRVHDPRPRWHL